jgi:hypothetical protein
VQKKICENEDVFPTLKEGMVEQVSHQLNNLQMSRLCYVLFSMWPLEIKDTYQCTKSD